MKIKELQKVIKELPINKRLKPDILGLKQDNVEKLYQLIKKGKVSNEEEAIQHIYPDNNYPIRALWKLKDSLIERIGNSALFLIPRENFNAYDRQKLKIYRRFHLFKFFSFTPLRSIARYYGEKTFIDAQKYHITDICLTLSIDLSQLFVLAPDEEANLRFFRNMVDKYFHIYCLEVQLEKILIDFIPKFRTKISLDKEEINEVRKTINSVKTIYPQGKSHKIEWMSSFILTNCYISLKEYDKTTEVCNKVLEELDQFKFEIHETILFVFESKKIPGLIINRNFYEAEKSIEKCQKIIPKNGHNYIATKQMQVLCKFHMKQYEKTLEIIDQTFKNIISQDETWEIYRAYACILTNRYFRLGRFLNQVPIFSKDKKGMNINILIIEMLEYLRKRVYSKIIDRTASLQRYAYRYLIDDESTYRSYQFFQIILCLEKGAFYKKDVEPLVQEYLVALHQHPLNKARQDYELEVVPYEHLWEFIRTLLR